MGVQLFECRLELAFPLWPLLILEFLQLLGAIGVDDIPQREFPKAPLLALVTPVVGPQNDDGVVGVGATGECIERPCFG
jgi:hypothetical protein